MSGSLGFPIFRCASELISDIGKASLHMLSSQKFSLALLFTGFYQKISFQIKSWSEITTKEVFKHLGILITTLFQIDSSVSLKFYH